MAPPAAELQRAVFQALRQDARFAALIGEAHVYERAPANAPLPHATFGRTGVYDYGTGGESDTEQLFTLHVWSKARDDAETREIMDAARAALDGRSLDGDVAFGLRLEFDQIRYDENLAVYHGMLRFRAVVAAPGQGGRRGRARSPSPRKAARPGRTLGPRR
ncbi:hypothetical protein MesoLjLc_59320 [Mesorhizobium sp. L-8-10]|uniref:DUF3168 domain-containing protein n=1 Tax=Mesorhizobium sp. L-8-10 TaxID=2744523 RepID=UPI001927280E|nr:DUF3168 domain-containing protein [Mesorhizobium sp. L-8-10]BCH34002.1 hypothetical protein MesoLjLc_59320 [Mesorhizobium sp. L-8-10]